VKAGCTHGTRPASNESGPSVLACLETMRVFAGSKLQLLTAGFGADMNLPA